jgi:hypothetical protein
VIGVGVITEVIPGNKIIQKVVSGIKKRKGSAGIDGDAVQPPKNQPLSINSATAATVNNTAPLANALFSTALTPALSATSTSLPKP